MIFLPRISRFVTMLLATIAVAASLSSSVAMAQTPNYASGGCTQTFLTLPAWYNGLLDGDCEVQSPTAVGGFTKFVTIIGLNIVEMILRLAGYASAAFIIYGGYKYIYSAGSPDGMVSARKTIMNAVIGLVISIAAVAIVNTIAKGV